MHRARMADVHVPRTVKLFAVVVLIWVSETHFARAEQACALTVQAEPELRALAHEVASVLSRRTGCAIDVGTEPPDPIEAVRRDELGIVRYEGGILVALGTRVGRTLTYRIEEQTRARVLALLIQDMVDEARVLTMPAPPPTRVVAPMVAPEREPRRYARPAFFFRMMAGYSTQQSRVLVGPGAGLGLCVGMGCMMIEADMPLLAVEAPVPGHDVHYRVINAALRLHLRPVTIGDVSLGGTLGGVTRILRVSVDELGAQTLTSFGLRTSLEVAWRFRGPFELVVEAGADVVFDQERLRLAGQFHQVDDDLIPWVTTSIRMRPRFDG